MKLKLNKTIETVLFNLETNFVYVTKEEYNNEVWKDIRDAPNYQISSLGRVRSLPHKIIITTKTGKTFERFQEGRILKSMTANRPISCIDYCLCISGQSVFVNIIPVFVSYFPELLFYPNYQYS